MHAQQKLWAGLWQTIELFLSPLRLITLDKTRPHGSLMVTVATMVRGKTKENQGYGLSLVGDVTRHSETAKSSHTTH